MGGRYEQESIFSRTNHWQTEEAEILLSKGQAVGEVVRKLGVSEQTYYRWRRDYGGCILSRQSGSRRWKRKMLD